MAARGRVGELPLRRAASSQAAEVVLAVEGTYQRTVAVCGSGLDGSVFFGWSAERANDDELQRVLERACEQWQVLEIVHNRRIRTSLFRRLRDVGMPLVPAPTAIDVEASSANELYRAVIEQRLAHDHDELLACAYAGAARALSRRRLAAARAARLGRSGRCGPRRPQRMVAGERASRELHGPDARHLLSASAARRRRRRASRRRRRSSSPTARSRRRRPSRRRAAVASAAGLSGRLDLAAPRGSSASEVSELARERERPTVAWPARAQARRVLAPVGNDRCPAALSRRLAGITRLRSTRHAAGCVRDSRPIDSKSGKQLPSPHRVGQASSRAPDPARDNAPPEQPVDGRRLRSFIADAAVARRSAAP